VADDVFLPQYRYLAEYVLESRELFWYTPVLETARFSTSASMSMSMSMVRPGIGSYIVTGHQFPITWTSARITAAREGEHMK
jgi:hypothetical protein